MIINILPLVPKRKPVNRAFDS